jgi:hypothetical protein
VCILIAEKSNAGADILLDAQQFVDKVSISILTENIKNKLSIQYTVAQKFCPVAEIRHSLCGTQTFHIKVCQACCSVKISATGLADVK